MDMRQQIVLLAAAAALSGGAAQAASVEIKDAVVRVTVIPEDRTDVGVEIIRPNAELPLSVRTFGDRTVIDGDLDHRIRNCDGGERPRIAVRGVGRVGWDEMPQVVIRAPRNVVLSSNGAVFGAIGRSASLELHNSGCSNWTVADVAGPAEIHESGAGSIRMGASDRLDVQMSGAAQIHATRVRQGLDARLSGAGGVRVDTLSGSMDAQVSGVGGVRVADGRASSMRASVSGLGSVEFGGAADRLNASISGMGSIRVKEVTGPVSKSVSGIGRVEIGK